MRIYYIMAEAVPGKGNEERLEFGGAYINLWVRAESKQEALTRAKAYVTDEDWIWLRTEEIAAAHREDFDEPESKECFDEAGKDGLAAMFYTWPLHEKPVS